MRPRDGFELVRAAFAGDVCLLDRPQRAGEPKRARTRGRIEITIPARHCEPIWFANRWRDDNFDGHVEILDHGTNEGRLLDVFLTEHGHVWLYDVEELGDHCKHALKVS